MRCLNWSFTVFLSWFFFISGTHQLQSYQTQVLLQLRKHLEYPTFLQGWENYTADFCSLPSTQNFTLTCENDTITELKFMGDKLVKPNHFNGFAIPNQTLSESFSIDSLITTLTRLSTLRVLSLVSLGIWGPLPDKLHRLGSLEVLDLSSNFIYGSVPPRMPRLVKLQSFTLDGNFFNATIPDWFDSLSNLTILSLKNNQFKGQFPPSVRRIKTLTDLSFSHNELNGKLPDLSSLTSLRLLDLRENQFDSELPVMPMGLVTILLSKNKLLGEIPEEYDELRQLQHLDLSFNSLTGTPPSCLFSLPNISYLNLASNQLRGSLSYELSCSDGLGFVDISSNKLSGELPSCLATNTDKRVVKFGWNCLLNSSQRQHQEAYCMDSNVNGKGPDERKIGMLIGVIGGTLVVMVFVAVGLLILFRKYCNCQTSEQHTLPKVGQHSSMAGIPSEILANARFISEAAKLGTQGAPSYRLFSIEELNEATNNFDQSMFMGEGSTGKLYKGMLDNGTYVAIRCLALFKKFSYQNIKLHLDLLSKLCHPHLVCILGHCIEGGGQDDTVGRVYLIFEYVPTGNFHSHLSENSPEKALNWSDRLAVLIGVAKAVHFLHTGVIPGFFNNRLKTNNILLDEHQIAKLSDYGMSVFAEEIEIVEARGEEPKSGQLTQLADDVYDFGFILLESLVGPIVSKKGEAFLLNEMASFGSQDGRKRMVDPIVLLTCSQESLSIVISITKKCISPDLSTRPSFEDVLWNLQYAAQVQATADADQKSDATSQS
ncbi:Leucine-rich repeat [Dillenia turbinata]|uniref:Leucine-rich repeat n=1 Tax=Dillenia turbinata TaxID=194707 RepID=A0AAN8VIX4_9MAGN